VFGDYLRGDAENGATSFPFVRRRGPVALIGVSSAVPTPPLMATGRLGRTQLDALDRTLAQLSSEQAFRVLLVHHPLHSDSRAKRLTDSQPLRALLHRHGVALVLHGHGDAGARAAAVDALLSNAGPFELLVVDPDPALAAALAGRAADGRLRLIGEPDVTRGTAAGAALRVAECCARGRHLVHVPGAVVIDGLARVLEPRGIPLRPLARFGARPLQLRRRTGRSWPPH